MRKLTGFWVALLGLTAFLCVAATPPRTVYVQFIRGSDQPSTTPNSREIGPKLSRKLSPVFRWKHFWELDRKKVTVQPKGVTRVDLPGDRKLELEVSKNDDIEVRLFRRTGLVTKARQPSNGDMCVLGGEDSKSESFWVVVRRDEPSTE